MSFLPATSRSMVLPFAVQPDLAATMDIQIPALAWTPLTGGGYRRAYHLDGATITVELTETDGGLRFSYDPPTDQAEARLRVLLQAAFPTTIGDLTLDQNPALRALSERYRGVVVMYADPFEALVLTMLSQNRSGELVRRVFPALAAHTDGATPASLAALPPAGLAEIIRSAGPYKAPRLAATARQVAADEDAFRAAVLDSPGPAALAYLQTFPGVAHKTAACVLAFSARSRTTLPVDTHLFRVVDRLGLARHGGKLTVGVRDNLIRTLLAYSPDVALAHFLFLLVGRTTCTASKPSCGACFLRPHCRYAALHHPATPAGQDEQ